MCKIAIEYARAWSYIKNKNKHFSETLHSEPKINITYDFALINI